MRESIHGKVRIPENAKAIEYGRRAGYKTGGAVSDEEQDKEMIKKAVHKHEKHDHPGEPETPLKKGGRIKRKHGGHVEGKEPMARLDKRPRKAGGGSLATTMSRPMKTGAGMKMTAPHMPSMHSPMLKKGGEVEKRARGGKTGKTNIIINTSPPGGAQGGADPMALQQAKQEGAKMGAMAVIQKIKGGAGGPPGMGAPPSAPPMGGPPPGMGAPPPGAMPPMHAKGGKVHSDETVKVKGHMRRKAGGKVGC